MRVALWLLSLFGLAVALVLTARLDQGYVLIVYPPWRVELSFMLAVMLAALLFLAAYVLVRVVRVGLRLPGEVKAWQAERHKRKTEDTLCQATAALLAGDSAEARKLADKILETEKTAMAALIAARAAIDAGDHGAATRYLTSVKDVSGQLEIARQALVRQIAQP